MHRLGLRRAWLVIPAKFDVGIVELANGVGGPNGSADTHIGTFADERDYAQGCCCFQHLTGGVGCLVALAGGYQLSRTV